MYAQEVSERFGPNLQQSDAATPSYVRTHQNGGRDRCKTRIVNVTCVIEVPRLPKCNKSACLVRLPKVRRVMHRQRLASQL